MNLHTIIAKALRPQVDSIIASINRKVDQLEAAAAANVAKANRSYDLASKLEKRGDSATNEAYRARRVAKNLKNLVS